MLIFLIKKFLERMTVSLTFLRSPQCVVPINILDKEKRGRYTKQLILTREEIGKCNKFDRKNKRMDNLFQEV